MLIRHSILIVSLFALGSSSLAAADDSTSPSNVSPNELPVVATISLDDAFEVATTPNSGRVLQAMHGPSRMQCGNGAAMDEFETCIVTSDAELAAVPAAPAPR